MVKKGILYPNQKLQAFDYQQVELLDEALKGQRNRAIQFLMNIPVDDLMRGFRVRYGQYTWDNVPGESLGGWYENHRFSGSTFGQWLSALSKYYLQTGQEEVLQRLEDLLIEFEKTIEVDG